MFCRAPQVFERGDKSLVLSACPANIKLWDATKFDREALAIFPGQRGVFSPTAAFAAVAESPTQTVCIWNLSTQTVAHRVDDTVGEGLGLYLGTDQILLPRQARTSAADNEMITECLWLCSPSLERSLERHVFVQQGGLCAVFYNKLRQHACIATVCSEGDGMRASDSPLPLSWQDN